MTRAETRRRRVERKAKCQFYLVSTSGPALDWRTEGRYEMPMLRQAIHLSFPLCVSAALREIVRANIRLGSAKSAKIYANIAREYRNLEIDGLNGMTFSPR